MPRFAHVVGSMLVFASPLACSGAEPAGGEVTGPGGAQQPATTAPCVARAPSSALELQSPVVRFEADVAPILAQSCAFSACHASRSASNHGVFLAAKSSDDAPAVKSALVARSHALPSMPYVTPGDPANSFLMHKLDDDLCALDAHCVGGSCGKSMPEANALLPEATRDIVRRWIAQGAK